MFSISTGDIDWSMFSDNFVKEYRDSLSRETCKVCGNDYPTTKGFVTGPEGVTAFYAEDPGFCSHDCENIGMS